MQKLVIAGLLSSLALVACSSGGGGGNSAAGPGGPSGDIVKEATKSGAASPRLIEKMKSLQITSSAVLPDIDLITGESSDKNSESKLDSKGRQWLFSMKNDCTIQKQKSPDSSQINGKGHSSNSLTVSGANCPVRYSQKTAQDANMDDANDMLDGSTISSTTASEQLVNSTLIS